MSNEWVGVPYAPGSDTSVAAAKSMRRKGPKLRKLVYDYLVSCGTRGPTDDEMEQALGLLHASAAPRRRRLVEMEAVYPTEERRPTRTGHMATVWLAVPECDVVSTRGRPPKAPEDALSKKLTVYMTAGQHENVKKMAKETGHSVGTTARKLMGIGWVTSLRGEWREPDNA